MKIECNFSRSKVSRILFDAEFQQRIERWLADHPGRKGTKAYAQLVALQQGLIRAIETIAGDEPFTLTLNVAGHRSDLDVLPAGPPDTVQLPLRSRAG
jgi:hypothetical protein